MLNSLMNSLLPMFLGMMLILIPVIWSRSTETFVLPASEWRCTDEEPEGCAEYRKIYGEDNPRPRRPSQELGQIKERLARAKERDAAALCPKAKPMACVCAYARECPDHGVKHIGAHDQ